MRSVHENVFTDEADAPLSLCSLTSIELASLAKTHIANGFGVWPKVYEDALVNGVFHPEKWGVSTAAVERWRRHFSLELLKPAQRIDEPSQHPVDLRDTVKVVLKTADNLEVECVRVPMSKGRNTLCISTQVGCQIGCRFCETGRIGLLRNLTAAEIVSQVVVARTVLKWPIHNIVFMGMGEPLDNPDHLLQALRVLTDPRGLGYGQQKITICTSGIPEGLNKLGTLGFRRMGLSFSLNAATDEKRSQIMPINRKYSLQMVREALINYPKREGFVLALNYCLLPGMNNERSDARAVAEFAKPLGRTLVNVIPYNPGTHPLTRAPQDHEVDTFIDWLKEEGVAVRVRRTKGRSVMAACGQLGNLELRKTRRELRQSRASELVQINPKA